jgi:hypothetical protein
MTKFVVEPDSNVVERFTRVSNDELLYQFTIEVGRSRSPTPPSPELAAR